MKVRAQPCFVVTMSTEVEVEPHEPDRLPRGEVDLEAVRESLDAPRIALEQGHLEVDDAAIRSHEARVRVRFGGAAEIDRPPGQHPATRTTVWIRREPEQLLHGVHAVSQDLLPDAT